MSTNSVQLSNGSKLTNGVVVTALSENGEVVMNTATTTSAVNGNGQLGATAMINLAKIASSDHKQSATSSSINSAISQPQIITSAPQANAQTRASLAHQPINAAPTPRQPQPILIPRTGVSTALHQRIFELAS